MWLTKLFANKENLDSLALKELEELQKKLGDHAAALREIYVALERLIQSKKDNKSLRQSLRQSLIARIASAQKELYEALAIEKDMEKKEEQSQHDEEKNKYTFYNNEIKFNFDELYRYFGDGKIKFGGDVPNADIRIKNLPEKIYFVFDFNTKAAKRQGFTDLIFNVEQVDKSHVVFIGSGNMRGQVVDFFRSNKKNLIVYRNHLPLRITIHDLSKQRSVEVVIHII